MSFLIPAGMVQCPMPGLGHHLPVPPFNSSSNTCNFDILFTCKNFDQFQPSLNIWCKKALIFLLLMNSKSNVPLSDVVISLLFFQIEEIERKYPITGV